MSIEYKCKNCTKTYTTYKSLWRHNSLKHGKNVVINFQEGKKSSENVVNVDSSNTICKYCDKKLCDRKYRWKHEQTCKMKINKSELLEIKEENLEIKLKNKKIEKENIEIKKEMEKLKEMLQKSLKIHPKTLTKINKQLNNNTLNNNNVNNIYVQLGRENLSDILSSKEKIGILNRQAMGLNDLIELVHASGKYKKFMNVCITNLQNTIAYKFDEKMNNFIAVNKNELLNDLVDSRVYDIEKFFEEYQTKFDAKKVEQIKKFLDRMGNEDDPLKGIKKEEIKLILYNNLEKIKSNENDMIKIDDKELEV